MLIILALKMRWKTVLNNAETKHFSMGHAVFSGTSWQCFTMFCDIQQELIILAGTDKCLTSLKTNSIHFEDRRSLQTTKKRLTHPTTCHVFVDIRFTWYQVPESMLHRAIVQNQSNVTNLAQRNFTMFKFHAVFHFCLQIDKADIKERYINLVNYKH